jgi:formate dehydrogenase (coenzyme F420) beta subunit
MTVNRILCIKDGDALGTLHHFLSGIWVNAGINAMLLPVEVPNLPGLVSRTIIRCEELTAVNPFAPVMAENAVSEVSHFLRVNHGHLALLLRPCELRTLVELEKRNRISWHNPEIPHTKDWLLIIAVDCPGTLTAEEYAHQVNIQGVDLLTCQALAVNQQNGLKTSQLRTACQICERANPQGADLTISAIGKTLPEYFLVIAKDEWLDQILHLELLTDRKASNTEVAQRVITLERIAEDHKTHHHHFCASGDGHFDDFCGLLACFSRCTLCADCLDACPLYEGELAGMLGVKGGRNNERPILSALVDIGRWLASCSGCGMCQEACKNNVPLMMLVSEMSSHIQKELNYEAGKPNQPLPW